MKTCKKCNIQKDFNDFYKHSRTKDKLSTWCKECKKTHAREVYKNSDQEKLKVMNRSNKRRERNMQYIYDYLKGHPCIDCGESDFVVLQFDHREPSSKLSGVSVLMRSSSLINVATEIAKCDVRCANCHIRKTAKEFNWYSNYNLL